MKAKFVWFIKLLVSQHQQITFFRIPTWSHNFSFFDLRSFPLQRSCTLVSLVVTMDFLATLCVTQVNTQLWFEIQGRRSWPSEGGMREREREREREYEEEVVHARKKQLKNMMLRKFFLETTKHAKTLWRYHTSETKRKCLTINPYAAAQSKIDG